MYIPHFNAADLDACRRMVASIGSAELVSNGSEASGGYPLATRLPVLWDEPGERLVFHLARANPHWRAITDGDAGLAVVTDAEAYVSPSWYASKSEHGRVVPTWNYSAVHFAGRLFVHPEADWLLEAVTKLTETHEQPRALPWSVNDAPADYIGKQLRAIVGVELRIERVEGKAKLSQNRDEADTAGVIAGLNSSGDPEEATVAAQMVAVRY